MKSHRKRDTFGSRLTVILALAGSAIGLGNLWRFPYMVGENGGSVFILLYILATLTVSLPIMFSEMIIGRRAGVNASRSMSRLRPQQAFWKWAGILPVFIPLFILSYYSVIGGWSIDYLLRAGRLEFLRSSPEEVSAMFDGFISSTWKPIVDHLVFLAMSFGIVVFGVKAGIERFCKWCLPLLFIITLGLAVYSICLPGAIEGVRYLMVPDFSRLSFKAATNALGQSFYSLSLGMGITITYASYISRKENLLNAGANTALSDLGFALLAGFAIIPALFAAGLTPNAGPGLLFKTLPYIFSQIGQHAPITSTVVSIFFFVSVVLAALTSIVALCEVGVNYLMETFHLKRVWSCLLLFAVCGLAGVSCSLSFGPWEGFHVAGRSLFDFFDWSSSNILLFVMAMLAVVFTGFVMRKDELYDEFTNGGSLSFNRRLFPVYRFLLRWLCPIALVVLFVSNFLN